MKRKFIAVLFVVLFFSCGDASGGKKIFQSKVKYPDTRFMVISDIHYFDHSLGTDASYFDKYMSGDRKMLDQSAELFRTMLEKIKAMKPEFLIVCGDMTKDGEEFNHIKVAGGLRELSKIGIKVFVIPGNHDINNPVAERYEKNRAISVETVSPEKFSEIYSEGGYSSAIERDKASLSYLAEPVKGLRLLALDSCKWKENTGRKKYVSSGKFEIATLRWIESILERSKNENIPVIVTLHHGIMEHFPGNRENYGSWVLDGYEEFSALLAAYGVQIVFTGHFHAQDITMKKFNGGASIYDIETGSLVTYPCPYREIEIKNSRMKISSGYIDSIPSMPDTFKKFKYDFIYKGTMNISKRTLQKYYVSENDINVISPQVTRAYMIHLGGDELKSKMDISFDGMGIWGGIVMFTQRSKVQGWMTDFYPADNNLTIDLINE